MTTPKREGCLQRLEESVLSTAKRVGGLQRFGECVFMSVTRVTGLADVRRVRFDNRNACRRIAEIL